MSAVEWQHPGEFETEPTMARLAWKLRIFCIQRFSREVTQPHHRALVTGEDFDVDRAFRQPPTRGQS